jgi:hypothetical protein
LACLGVIVWIWVLTFYFIIFCIHETYSNSCKVLIF